MDPLSLCGHDLTTWRQGPQPNFRHKSIRLRVSLEVRKRDPESSESRIGRQKRTPRCVAEVWVVNARRLYSLLLKFKFIHGSMHAPTICLTDYGEHSATKHERKARHCQSIVIATEGRYARRIRQHQMAHWSGWNPKSSMTIRRRLNHRVPAGSRTLKFRVAKTSRPARVES